MSSPGQTRRASVSADGSGPSADPSDLIAQVYAQLRQLARRQMAQERNDHTLQTTALVHEAYIRLFGSGRPRFESRQHFFRAAAEAMRRILIEHARTRGAAKRGGRLERVPLDLVEVSVNLDRHDILCLDELITKLEQKNPDAASVVRLRFYAGLSVDETAEALGVNPRTVDRMWKFSRAWLFREWRADPS